MGPKISQIAMRPISTGTYFVLYIAAVLMKHIIILLSRVQTRIKATLVMMITTVPVQKEHGVPEQRASPSLTSSVCKWLKQNNSCWMTAQLQILYVLIPICVCVYDTLSSSVNATLPSPASSFFCWFLMGL
jgi:hypothetical protein